MASYHENEGMSMTAARTLVMTVYTAEAISEDADLGDVGGVGNRTLS